jgi:predicted RNase H-like nuclease (RuvC/YqgF family)
LEVKRDHEIKIRDKEIARLRGLLRSERKFIKRLKAERARAERAQEVQDKQGYLRLKPVEAFSKEAILAAAERWSLGEGDIILLKNASGGGPNTADLLVQMGVLAVITQGEMPLKTKEYLSQKGIPVFSEGSLPLEIIDDMAFLKPEDLEAAKARWEEGRRAKEAEAKVEWLEGMIKDYRVTRRKEEQRARKDSGKVQAH